MDLSRGLERQCLDNAIKQIVAPRLKPRLFKKSGRYFYKYTDEFIQVINFQGSWTGGLFFVNLGVYIQEIPDIWKDDFIIPTKIIESSCHMRSRLMTEDDREKGLHDHIWLLYPNQIKTNAVVDKLVEVLLTEGINWLDYCSDFTNIIDIYNNRKDELLSEFGIGVWADLLAAVSFDKLGQKDKANQIITQYISSPNFKTRGKAMQQYSLKLQERTRKPLYTT
ncbi:MAG: DUF4304 domain-containing protein [bacterium]